MRRIKFLDRFLLIFGIVIASYQIISGIEGLDSLATICFTVGFGVLIVSGLLIFVLGLEAMNTSYVAIISSIVPLSLSAGLVANFYPMLRMGYLILVSVAFLFIIITRCFFHPQTALFILIAAHTISGLLIFILPLAVFSAGTLSWMFCLVSFGGAIIGVYGILLSLARSERPLVAYNRLITFFPLVFLLTTVYFTLGFLAL